MQLTALSLPEQNSLKLHQSQRSDLEKKNYGESSLATPIR